MSASWHGRELVRAPPHVHRAAQAARIPLPALQRASGLTGGSRAAGGAACLPAMPHPIFPPSQGCVGKNERSSACPELPMPAGQHARILPALPA